MRTIFALFFAALLPLVASEPDLEMDLKAGVMQLREAPNTPTASAKYSELTLDYKGVNANYTNSPLYKYMEAGYEAKFGFSGSAYSYLDGGTAGLRLQYKYKDKSSYWSPFIGLSAQHSSWEYAGIQPRTNFGGTLGLVYSENKEHLFKLTCFRELRRGPVASSELLYEYEGERYFTQVKLNITFGDPGRDDKTKKFFGGGVRFGANLTEHMSLYGYAEKFHYADFLLYTQQNIGLGLRASF